MLPYAIFIVLFLEGFSSVAIELIAIRQLVPAVGANIVVTSWTIGVFLLALALGYRRGGLLSRSGDIEALKRSLAYAYGLSATWLGTGLSLPFVLSFFAMSADWQVLLLGYVLLVLLVPVVALGQTIPVLASLASLSSHRGTGELAGNALFLSTLGSVVSALLLPTLLFQWLGVQATLAVICLVLLLVALLFAYQLKTPFSEQNLGLLVLLMTSVLAIATNTKAGQALLGDTAYALYEIRDSSRPKLARELLVNKQLASAIGGNGSHVLAYVEAMRKRLARLAPASQVLVVGAGGFTLSADSPPLQFTYVDIDPAIRDISERHLLKTRIRGDFVADDGRHFLGQTAVVYQAIVLDAFTSHLDAPAHMSSIEFYTLVKKRLAPNGLLLINAIVDAELDSDYAQRTLNSVETVFGQCELELVNPQFRLANAIITCKNRMDPERDVYRDDTTSSQTDFLHLSRRSR